MRKTVCGILAIGVLLLGMLAVNSQPPGGQENRGGPPRGGPGGRAPRFELGRVLPPFARQELSLSKDQEEQIAKLEQEVNERLSKILTADQKKRLENLRPPGPGGGGPAGGRGPQGGRPAGPGGPAGSPEGNGPTPPGKPVKPEGGEEQGKADNVGGIQWFASWSSGVHEATKTGRPILLISAAPHCAGVPGIW